MKVSIWKWKGGNCYSSDIENFELKSRTYRLSKFVVLLGDRGAECQIQVESSGEARLLAYELLKLAEQMDMEKDDA